MKYLVCVLDDTMSGETIALGVIEKMNSGLNFLYRENWFLDSPFRRLLCNALIQPHFDCTCIASNTNLTKKLKDKIYVTQNKYIRFCLKSKCKKDISNEQFERLNCPPNKSKIQTICHVFSILI